MDAVLERCAGLDVHQETVVACVLSGPLDRKPQQEIRTFGTTTRELLALSDWLVEKQCSHVAMESTGVYWKAVWNVLEGHFTLVLGNAKKIKNVPGRKTDVKDAAWIASLLRCGLIEPNFVPPVDIRDLRDLTRYRRKLQGQVTSEKNRIHKVLQDANIKLTTYVSDLFGKSGLALLEALVNGEVLDAKSVKDMVFTQLKKKVPELIEALNGRLRVHHRFLIGRHLVHLRQVEEHIEALQEEIDRLLILYRKEIDLLVTIPGIQEDAAASILAEIGADMSVFPSENHLASWAAVCPGNHESAGKKRSSKTNKGNKGLKAVLCQAAWASSKTKNTRLAAFYNRVVKRRGPKKAAMATAHLILKICYFIIREKTPYQELGWDYLPRKEKGLDYWVSKIKSMGYSIQIQDTHPA
ncbi:IS110 family transposase [Paenibacillus cremeus]|uniref:IS110 family transposase n=1 Tax=Paenibacillus cremeus TaxID=2163881 RepID=A0A559K825_9BACL|nr:IS110 family transposase [Paenibacillus cremeus]TVY08233.1 IS110 family transposase [Paenibacillus cremeus]